MLEKTSPSLWGNDQNIYNKNSRNWNLLRCTNAKKIAPGTPNNQLKWMFGETTISILLPVTLEELFRPFCSLSDEITGPRWWRENRMFIHFLFYLCLLKKMLVAGVWLSTIGLYYKTRRACTPHENRCWSGGTWLKTSFPICPPIVWAPRGQFPLVCRLYFTALLHDQVSAASRFRAEAFCRNIFPRFFWTCGTFPSCLSSGFMKLSLPC